jgi:signal transduction histidine kinase
MPVKARIESIETEHGHIASTIPLKFAAGTQSIAFKLSSTNLSSPQRVRYRYRLEGSAEGWSEDVQSRRVVYSNLGPGHFVFRVVASNGAGLWSGDETALPFDIAPAYWQTAWFRILCWLACVVMIFGAYRWRLAVLTNRLSERFQERLAERTRIARDLHDTLLQGVLSASFQLDLIEDQTSDQSPTKPRLKRVLELLSQVTEEGRQTLRGLRNSSDGALGIEAALSRVSQEFTLDEGPEYKVTVYGTPRVLQPAIRDDVYGIAREAVVNAFRHADAAKIEVEVEYAHRHLRILVRDDGRGVDQKVLRVGREGHWGLSGMRERSESIGSSLQLRSRPGAGTEVELLVPGRLAFSTDITRGLWNRRQQRHAQSPARQDDERKK